MSRFEFRPVQRSAADIKDDLAKRNPHRNFNKPGVFDIPGKRKYLCPCTLRRADGSEPRTPANNDRSDVRIRLDVIDERGHPP